MLTLCGLLASAALVAAEPSGRLPGELLRPEIHAEVIRVLDGDTIDVRSPEHGRLRVRYAGIDAPEHGQRWAAEATAYLRDLIDGREVRIVVVDEQPPRGRWQGRVIGFVYRDELDTGRALVERGLAWAFDAFLRDPTLCAVEQQARIAGHGIWSDPPSRWLPPWVHRAREGGRPAEWVARCPREDLE